MSTLYNPLQINEDNEYVCDYCGEDVEEPKYLLMIPAKPVMTLGCFKLLSFNKLVEELLGMTQSQIVNIVEDSDGTGAFRK